MSNIFTVGKSGHKFVPLIWLDGTNGNGMTEYEAKEVCERLNSDPGEGVPMDAAFPHCGNCGADMVPTHAFKCTRTQCGNTVR